KFQPLEICFGEWLEGGRTRVFLLNRVEKRGERLLVCRFINAHQRFHAMRIAQPIGIGALGSEHRAEFAEGHYATDSRLYKEPAESTKRWSRHMCWLTVVPCIDGKRL